MKTYLLTQSELERFQRIYGEGTTDNLKDMLVELEDNKYVVIETTDDIEDFIKKYKDSIMYDEVDATYEIVVDGFQFDNGCELEILNIFNSTKYTYYLETGTFTFEHRKNDDDFSTISYDVELKDIMDYIKEALVSEDKILIDNLS